MGKIKTFVYMLKNDKSKIAGAVVDNLTMLPVSHVFPDKMYLGLQYKTKFGKRINWKKPKTFNEKLQWLKIYNRKPEYIKLVDKYEVKLLMEKNIGSEYIIPTMGVWEDAEDINLKELPESFVLKCTHDSRSVEICKEKKKFDFERAKKNLNKCLKKNLFWHGREWPYKNVTPRIIAEKYMSDESGELIDYKVHNFNGEPKFILVCKDRFKDSGLTEDFYTVDWERMPVKRPGTPNSSTPMEKPEQLEEILKLSRKLAKDIPFVRTDFYIINGKVFFSELTFYPASGFSKFEPEKWDRTFGDWIKLPSDRINTGR